MAQRERTRRGRKLSVLLLADDHPNHATTVLEHIAALRRLSRHNVSVFNPRGLRGVGVLDLDEFDVVAIHYTLMVTSEHYLPRDLRRKIESFDGLKIQFIQDDYRQVNEISAVIQRLGVEVLFTLVPEREVDKVWSPERLPAVTKITTLAGYVSDAALRFQSPDVEVRPLDVGYRGRQLPFWLGIIGQEKAWIGEEFLRRAAGTGLRCDIGWRETDRIYGRSWFEWISSCRATLGTESGATITDFDGSLQRKVEAHLREYPQDDFWTVHKKFLEPFEGNVRMNVISPRIFEAAALRTALVLFPGHYSGVVERDRHYICLEKDFSNFDEVVEQLRDIRLLRQLTDRTYEEVAREPRYSLRSLIAQFDDVVDERYSGSPRSDLKLRYAVALGQRKIWTTARPAVRAPTISRRSRSGTFAHAAAAGMLIAGDGGVMRVFAAMLGRGGDRPPLRAVTRDLLRLAYIRRAQTGRLNAGEAFKVFPETDGSTIVMRSTRLPSSAASSTNAHEMLSRGPEALEWDHSAVADWFPDAITRSRWVSFAVGENGRYRFDTLAVLGRRAPAIVHPVLEETLTPPATDDYVVPRGWPLVLHLLRHVDHYIAHAVVAGRLIGRNRQLRRLALAALREPSVRTAAGTREIVGDITKLALLGRARRGELIRGVRVDEFLDGTTLCFRSTPADAPAAAARPAHAARAEVDRIVWDHSFVGNELTVDEGTRSTFALGPGGVHEFLVLAKLLQTHRRLVADAIESS